MSSQTCTLHPNSKSTRFPEAPLPCIFGCARRAASFRSKRWCRTRQEQSGRWGSTRWGKYRAWWARRPRPTGPRATRERWSPGLGAFPRRSWRKRRNWGLDLGTFRSGVLRTFPLPLPCACGRCHRSESTMWRKKKPKNTILRRYSSETWALLKVETLLEVHYFDIIGKL